MPKWFHVQGENGFQEYTDDREMADQSLDVFGGMYEERSRPSSDSELNQPQTTAGRIHCALVDGGWLSGDPTDDR